MNKLNLRYSFGGDEYLFVEVSESMSLEAFFCAMAMCTELRNRQIDGISEICPANASFQIRFDPDRLPAESLLQLTRNIHSGLQSSEPVLQTRIIEIPVLYDDPWTRETQSRFRDRHQDPASADLAYAAQLNGYASVAEFILAHSDSPWLVSMVGFVAGLPFMFQMVEQEKQIQVPKYLRPRTDTPKLTIGHGGCFACVYSVRGAGGYQMFGITPAPIFDPAQKLPYLQDFMCFFRPGDIVKFKPISLDDYQRDLALVASSRFDLRIRPVEFRLNDFLQDPAATRRQMMEALYVD